ncbi:alkylphosphonate utilization protein [Acetobacteraceae bacterium]|nr:alkylphosphonate utilization protein [Acetobacteraceae bacterium]
MTDPICPKCACEHAYPDGSGLWICPECSHEWNPEMSASEEDDNLIKDSVGNVLNDGDTVTVIKDLKIKGSSQVIKGGTKVKNIRLADGGNGHDIACKIPGIGNMDLKSEFVRKA